MNYYIWVDVTGSDSKMDWKLLYYPGDPEYTLNDIAINMRVDDAGSLKFKIYKTHPNIQYITLGHSKITVTKTDDLDDTYGTEFFWSFISEIDEDEEGAYTVYCTGMLGVLEYTIQPQYMFQGTPKNYLIRLLDCHNRMFDPSPYPQIPAFRIQDGTVDTDDDYILRYTNYETTLECLRNDLMEPLGLYPKITRDIYGWTLVSLYPIDTYGDLSNQQIRFGENLLKFARNRSTDDLYTAVIPLGKKKENNERTSSDIAALDAYVDISSVNSGEVILVNSTAKDMYGLKCAVVQWEDVTQPSNLKTKAQAWLNTAQYEGIRLELTAIDLSLLGNNIDEFKVGDRVRCIAEPYGVDITLPIYEMTIYPLDPGKNTVTLGMDSPTITSSSSSKSIAGSTAIEGTVDVGTVNSSITASRANCRLVKVGNIVFITVGLGNVTSSPSTSTTLFTIPSAYRPTSTVTIQGFINSSEGNVTINSSGEVKQTLTGSMTNMFASGFYTI